MSRIFFSILMQVFSEEGKDKVKSFFDIPLDLRFRLENKNKMQTWAPRKWLQLRKLCIIWNKHLYLK